MSDTDIQGKPATISIRRRIEWMDTDAAGIYHWTTVFRLSEAAEAAMHTALGVADVTFGATPRVSVQADFRGPLVFNDIVDARLTVTRVGRSSASYALEVTGVRGLAAEGQVTICFIDKAAGKAQAWPAEVRQALLTGGELNEVALDAG